MKTLYISDLDGTLLRNDGAISDFSRDTLNSMIADGLPFTVASARSVVSMKMILAGLNLRLPIVEFNGAFISDWETGRHQVVNSIEKAIVEDVYGLIGDFRCVPFISTARGDEDRLYYNDAVMNDGMQWYLDDRIERRDHRLRRVDDLADSFGDRVVCITVIAKADLLADLQCAIGARHGPSVELHYYENQYSPGWHWLTIHDRRASKDQGIQVIRDCHGLHGHELVVFGDENNDVKMFKAANRSIAVANATEALKLHASHVIGPNEEDSVVRFIREDWRANGLAPGL